MTSLIGFLGGILIEIIEYHPLMDLCCRCKVWEDINGSIFVIWHINMHIGCIFEFSNINICR